ncbi:MAG: 4-hydroxy-tetrahydrodipicolinate reductase [Firmicutes bacterium]|nr:4-hydroxy-tetrahydrodipicolinate reductase [Bacillota bacterium]
MSTRVIVAGAAGKMGREVMKAVLGSHDLELAGGVDLREEGRDLGELAALGHLGSVAASDLAQEIDSKRPDVLVDFTSPQSVVDNVHIAIERGVHAVVGTTGMSQSDIASIDTLCRRRGVGAVIAPNFAIGAVLMMRFAALAARFFPKAEVIELHHDQKKDAPSGTAIKTAEMILAARRQAGAAGGLSLPVAPGDLLEKVPGARGASMEDIHLHSVRLPGLVAHQEVIMGLPGQILSIRHDSISRESFMPGVLLAIRRVRDFHQAIYGLEHLLFDGESSAGGADSFSSDAMNPR